MALRSACENEECACCPATFASDSSIADRLARTLRVVPDFPKPGIQFQDIGPVLADPALWRDSIDALAKRVESTKPSKVVGMEARGFLVGIALAARLGVGFVMLRKPSKLPGEKISVDYGLEYGKDRLEVSAGALARDDRVVVADDLLATGGTVEAGMRLVEMSGASVVACAFLVQLTSLRGSERIGARNPGVLVRSLYQTG